MRSANLIDGHPGHTSSRRPSGAAKEGLSGRISGALSARIGMAGRTEDPSVVPNDHDMDIDDVCSNDSTSFSHKRLEGHVGMASTHGDHSRVPSSFHVIPSTAPLYDNLMIPDRPVEEGESTAPLSVRHRNPSFMDSIPSREPTGTINTTR